MTITAIGVATLIGLLITLGGNKRQWIPWLLSASMPFMSIPAITLAGVSVPAFFLVALVAGWFVFVDKGTWTLFGASRGMRVLLVALGALVICAAVGAWALPQLFEGMGVLAPRLGLAAQAQSSTPLVLSTSNLAQVAYLVLGVVVIVYFLRYGPAPARVMSLGFGIGTLLNSLVLLQVASGVGFSIVSALGGEGFGTYLYNGSERLSGVFSEPSYMAVFCMAAASFFVVDMARVSGANKIFDLVMLALNSICVYFAYSGTAVLTIGIVVAALVVVVVFRFVFMRVRVPWQAFVLSFIALPACIVIAPRIVRLASTLASDKASSASYDLRSFSDNVSWKLVAETLGAGVGLGSHRPSSFALMLLSNLGALGFGLFCVVLITVAYNAIKSGGYAAELWTLLTVLVAKTIAEPNLNQPVMWMALGVLASTFAGRRQSKTARQPANFARIPTAGSSVLTRSPTAI